MKKYQIFLFILFLTFGAFIALTQSNLPTKFLTQLIQNEIQSNNLNVKFEKIDGTLPDKIKIYNLNISDKIHIEFIELKASLWQLLKKEIAFENVKAKNIQLDSYLTTNFEGKIRANKYVITLIGKVDDTKTTIRYKIKDNQAIITAQNEIINAKGKLNFNKEYQLQNGQIQIGSNQLLKLTGLELEGRVHSNIKILKDEEGYQVQSTLQIPTLTAYNKKIQAVKGKIDTKIIADKATASVFIKASKDWQLTSQIEYKLFDSLVVKDIELNAPFAKLFGNIEILPDKTLIGSQQIEIQNLNFYNNFDVYGALKTKAIWSKAKEKQILHLDSNITDFYFKEFKSNQLYVYSDIEDPFSDLQAVFDIEFEKAKYKSLEFDSLNVYTNSDKDFWPINVVADGKYKHPFEIKCSGSWDRSYSLQIDELSSRFYNQPVDLVEPCLILIENQKFEIPNISLRMSGADFKARVKKETEKFELVVKTQNLPLDILSFNPLEVPIEGKIDIDLDLFQKNKDLEGTFQANIHNMSYDNKAFANGSMEAILTEDQIDFKANLQTVDYEILKIEGYLPVSLSFLPYEFQIQKNKRLDISMNLDGRIEEFLDFFDLGSHRFEGDIKLDMRLKNSLQFPKANGFCSIQNGSYLNFATGTHLDNITAFIEGNKDQFDLKFLTANDGKLKAFGKMDLSHKNSYPFQITASLNDLPLAQIDLIETFANGTVQVKGDTKSAIATGKINLTDTTISIPNHIPKPLPNLQVEFINPTKPTSISKPSIPIYPIYLDVLLQTPDGLKIEGRGLESSWSGNFNLKGTAINPSFQGKIELIDGSFNFSSRSFKLQEGSLILSGKQNEMPILNLSGSLTTKGVTITATLFGPLNEPQITLQSLPPLPLGSIVSYLLFGQDVSEISGFQAFELANSLASLAGTGPDIMESTKKSLGVDRLRVISDPDEEGNENVSLQVGKYVSKGVLVTLTQSANDSAPDISVDVELKNNFTFQVESDQHLEQGKFTIKWSINY